ncbi:TadE/TadG family type IV pilus assembly protein [Glutamicibacter nicotianae]|uniref:TadE/TadG family type IV pilus assembly protein n=1 Tax=Glutamicibacter nicotianae TaxID=37929 RepID=UPI0013CE919E|nr:pilus assembly protein TadG-related protein [Glutamicibacter nicotianae]
MKAKWWQKERGEAPVILVFGMIPVLLIVIGLFMENGALINAQERATLIAQSAARAGVNGGITADTSINAELARRAAQKYLTQSGAEGSVAVQNGKVTVRAVIPYEPKFLPIGNKEGVGIGAARVFKPGQ